MIKYRYPGPSVAGRQRGKPTRTRTVGDLVPGVVREGDEKTIAPLLACGLVELVEAERTKSGVLIGNPPTIPNDTRPAGPDPGKESEPETPTETADEAPEETPKPTKRSRARKGK